MKSTELNWAEIGMGKSNMFCKRGYQSIVCAEEAKLQKQKRLGNMSLFFVSYNDNKLRTYDESTSGYATIYLDVVLTLDDEC